MTFSSIIETVEQFWLQFLLTAISGFLAWKCKGWYSSYKKGKEEEEKDKQLRLERLKVLETGVLAMLHDRLLQSMVYFLKQKRVTSDEFDNIQKMYEAYKSLGGNGTIEVMWSRFKNLRIEPPDYLLD